MPRTLVSLRMDDHLRTRLAAAARRRGATPSELLRRAVELWLDQDEGRAHLSPGDSIAELVGSLEGGIRDRSVRPLHGARDRARRGARVLRRKK